MRGRAAERDAERPDPLMPASRSGNSGSVPISAMPICITFIQNRIAIVLCTGISFLVPMFETA